MKKQCVDEKSYVGVFARSLSGDSGHNPICSLTGRELVYHIVKIENLMLYPADIKCTGSIKSVPKRIHFSSSQPGLAGISSDTWTGSIAGLHSDHTFDHTILLAIAPATGTETINADVSISWPHRDRGRVLSLSIRVDT